MKPDSELTPAQLYQRRWYEANKEVVKQRTREWAAANKERKIAADRAYRQANRAAITAAQKEWAAKNPDRRKANYTGSRQENIDAYRAREAAYRESNREACNARIREWKARNKHLLAMYSRERQAVKMRAMPAWANREAIAEIYQRARAMGDGYHVDHIVPLRSKLVCGLHCEANLQVLPATENLRKNNRKWPDMP